MNGAALQAHMRLASLPSWGRRRVEPDELAKRQEAAEKANRTRLANGKSVRGPAPVVLPSVTPNLPATPKLRKKRAPDSYGARSNRWGFTLGEPLEVAGDGKSWAGSRGTFVGVSSSTDVYLLIGRVKAAVRADRVRRVA